MILDDNLPTRTTIYITVRAYNRVGLWSERSSNGFQIDESVPEVVQEPVMDATMGVIRNGSQVNSSSSNYKSLKTKLQ